MPLKFTRKDMRGVVGMNPTPSTPNASDWRETMSVDLKTAERLFNLTLDSGVAGYALCGTTGECAALLWEEKQAHITTAVETVKKRGVRVRRRYRPRHERGHPPDTRVP